MTHDSPVKLSAVFVPGKMPDHTYNPRSDLHLEVKLQDYVDEGGAILTLSGPTKTGKTVLVGRVIENAAKIESQGIGSVDELWTRVVDALGGFSTIEIESRSGEGFGTGAKGSGSLGVLGTGASFDYQSTDEHGLTRSVSRPISSVAREVLRSRGGALVIDDFHFVERAVQRDIVRALKPLVLAGVPIILISISHRVQDVVTAEPDMTGRVESLKVKFWDIDELSVIAQKGFAALNVRDPGGHLAKHLADRSYGSPHLMQRFCRELCKSNGVRFRQQDPVDLVAPLDWDGFFAEQTDEASADWFRRLLRGAQERGSERTKWQTKDFGRLDYYGVTLAAIAKSGPELALSKDAIRSAAESIVVSDGPAANQITRALIHMTKIASTRMGTPPPTEDDLDSNAEEFLHDVQPVLEYIEDGPASMLYIADPFFAHFMRYGSSEQLKQAGADEESGTSTG